jgi:hypothetical protein
LTVKATNKKDASDKYVTVIAGFAKSPSSSLPVKRAIGECFALIIATVANPNARKLIHTTMSKEVALSDSS